MRMSVFVRTAARWNLNFAAFTAVLLVGTAGFSMPLAAQDLRKDLTKFVETPAVPGYEQALGKEIRSAVAKWKPQSDTIGNVVVTIGSGSPHRLIATPMDEPGYVVSGITPDGFLRVQRLPQTAPNPVFDILYSAEPVQIFTRSGKTVTGVVAGLSTHLQSGRVNPPQDNNLDDIYVDIGAASAAEVHTAGVDVLDPLAIERHLYEMGYGRMTGAAVGDRFGCASLVELLRHLDVSKVHGTLTVAFVVQQWAASRGIDRILQQFSASQRVDEFVYVGRLLARRAPPAAGAAAAAPAAGGAAAGAGGAAADATAQGGRGGGRGAFVPIEPKQLDGAGVLIGGGATATLTDFASELWNLASKNNIIAVADATAPLPRGRDAIAVPLPARFAHLSIATRWASTPGEIIDVDDLVALTRLLELYAQGSAETQPLDHASAPLARPALPTAPKVAPTATEIVSKLVETYGVSTHEADVRALVLRLLPPWAKPETDETGDVWVHLGNGTKGTKAPRLAVVAHMDEIGFEVRAIEPDGRLQVISRGGGIMDYFYAHSMLVHTVNGDHPGVIELPPTWTQAGTVLSGRGAAGAGAAGGAGAGGGAADANPTLGGAAADGGAGRGGGAGAQGGAAGAAAGGARWNLDVGARNADEVAQLGIKVGDWATIPKKYRPLFGRRANGRSFDDRVGCAAAISALWALGPDLPGRDVTFIFSTGEEIGLVGAAASAKKMAADGRTPDYVFAIDTFVSSDSPLESKRFADALLGRGFVVRAVDGSNITPRELSDKVVRLCRVNNIPVQYGVTGGGNDGSTFLPYGTIDIGMGWPLRYSHSPGEVIDTRDLDALAHVLAVVAKSW